MRSFLGENDMMAYLTMMAVRLLELHRVLKPTGSLYLHCDPTASHYLKIVLDGIFGRTQIAERNYLDDAQLQKDWHSRGSRPIMTSFYIIEPLKFTVGIHNTLYIRPNTWNGIIWSILGLDVDFKQRRFSIRSRKPAESDLRFSRAYEGWRWTRERMLRAEAEGKIYFPPHGGSSEAKNASWMNKRAYQSRLYGLTSPQ